MNLGIFRPLVYRSAFAARSSTACLRSSRLPSSTLSSQFRQLSTHEEGVSLGKTLHHEPTTVEEAGEIDSKPADHASDSGSTSNQTALSSRKASRLARKQRRIDTGAYTNKRMGYEAVSTLTDNDTHDGLSTTVEHLDENLDNSTPDSSESQTELHNRTTDEPAWKTRKKLTKERLGGDGWNPTRKLSPSTIEGIRALYEAYGEHVDLRALSKQFDVSFEAMRRIVKSKSWKPTEDEQEKRQKRWEARGERIWTKLAEKGVRPPSKWRKMGVGDVTLGKVSEEKQSQWWADNVERLMAEEMAKDAPEKEKIQ
jgi:hypothetical protein